MKEWWALVHSLVDLGIVIAAAVLCVVNTFHKHEELSLLYLILAVTLSRPRGEAA